VNIRYVETFANKLEEKYGVKLGAKSGIDDQKSVEFEVRKTKFQNRFNHKYPVNTKAFPSNKQHCKSLLNKHLKALAEDFVIDTSDLKHRFGEDFLQIDWTPELEDRLSILFKQKTVQRILEQSFEKPTLQKKAQSIFSTTLTGYFNTLGNVEPKTPEINKIQSAHISLTQESQEKFGKLFAPAAIEIALRATEKLMNDEIMKSVRKTINAVSNNFDIRL
ncbi:MAG: hypothetical protein AAF182_04170, partial [Pseudomonadota bacterium]